MSTVRSGEHDRVEREWFGARAEGQMPVRAETGGRIDDTEQSQSSVPRWLRLGLRIVRDALIGAVLISSVPVAFIAIKGPEVWRDYGWENTLAKVRGAEPARRLALPQDPSITPIEAGRAFARLGTVKATAMFPTVDVGPPAERGWTDPGGFPADRFPDARPKSVGGWSNQTVIESVARGLTPDELRTLRAIATSPVWVDFDRFARAPAADIFGARYQLPFTKTATTFEMPITRFAGSKELAYASVSRAAYYLAIGQKAEGEAALRSTIGFGFTMIDNGTTVIDQLIGRVIVGIGRDGLQRYFTATHDPRLAEVIESGQPAKAKSAFDPTWPNAQWSTENVRQYFLESAQDPKLLRGARFASLAALSRSSCTNVRELLFGPRPEVTQAFEQAKRDLARYPSERAFIDLMTTDLARVRSEGAMKPLGRWMIGAATIGSTITGNPRIAACTTLLGNYF
jgi:hypothetical protein